jgi:hypothetical protein
VLWAATLVAGQGMAEPIIQQCKVPRRRISLVSRMSCDIFCENVVPPANPSIILASSLTVKESAALPPVQLRRRASCWSCIRKYPPRNHGSCLLGVGRGESAIPNTSQMKIDVSTNSPIAAQSSNSGRADPPLRVGLALDWMPSETQQLRSAARCRPSYRRTLQSLA